MANENDISSDDLFGRFYVAAVDQIPYLGYYKTIRKISQLLENIEFLRSLTGFFVNANNFKNVRISYFVHEKLKDRPIAVFRHFLKEADLKEKKPEEKPHIEFISRGYGGPKYELRFRKYLNIISKIALELLRKNPQNAKSLALTYRWQVFPSKAPSKSHFQPSFEKYSDTYRSLSYSQREQLWADLDFWEDESNFDWAHFLINPIIACDWPNIRLIRTEKPRNISEINILLSDEFKFKIPLEWTPSE